MLYSLIRNNRLSCTLMEDFVDELMSYLDKSSEEEHIVIIHQMYHAKRFKGEIYVPNTYHVTQIKKKR